MLDPRAGSRISITLPGEEKQQAGLGFIVSLILAGEGKNAGSRVLCLLLWEGRQQWRSGILFPLHGEGKHKTVSRVYFPSREGEEPIAGYHIYF